MSINDSPKLSIGAFKIVSPDKVEIANPSTRTASTMIHIIAMLKVMHCLKQHIRTNFTVCKRTIIKSTVLS